MIGYRYTDRLTRQEDGAWCWSCSQDKDYYMRSIRPGIIACVIIAVFILAFGAFLAVPDRAWDLMAIIAGSDAVFVLICFVVFWAVTHGVNDPREIYELQEDYVKQGSGKSSVYFAFSKAKQAVFTQKYIDLKGAIASFRLYVPQEDMSFVKNYIMSRLPDDADIRYE